MNSSIFYQNTFDSLIKVDFINYTQLYIKNYYLYEDTNKNSFYEFIVKEDPYPCIDFFFSKIYSLFLLCNFLGRLISDFF